MSTRGTRDRLSPQELTAWQGFLRVSTRLGRLLDAESTDAHGLSGNDYDVLIQLGLAPKRRLHLTALASQVLMSPSGISRLVDELERRGLVERERREDDARSYDVVLTPTGRTQLKKANRTHLAQVREHLLDRLSDGQLDQLAEIWSALDPALTASTTSAAQATPGRRRRPQQPA